MRKTLLLLLVLGLAAVAGAQARTAARADVMHQIQLNTFRVNADHTVTVFVTVRGWKMYPALVGKKTNKMDGGHWHIYVNGKYNTYSANPKSGKTTKLKKGDYKIYVALANNDHSLVKGAHHSRTVTVMVG